MSSTFAISVQHVDKNYRLWGRRSQFATLKSALLKRDLKLEPPDYFATESPDAGSSRTVVIASRSGRCKRASIRRLVKRIGSGVGS